MSIEELTPALTFLGIISLLISALLGVLGSLENNALKKRIAMILFIVGFVLVILCAVINKFWP
jgi:hypothetical protein